jgi:riboflavin biosynthesis pyrimidine reductase
MTKESLLYKIGMSRLGEKEMAGIDSLLREGHTGLAESALAKKLLQYVILTETGMGLPPISLEQY